jgi:very-short-patch-repair endonuclease
VADDYSFSSNDLELEKWDGHKHIDLAIVKAKLNIEIDGSQHHFNPRVAFANLKRAEYSQKKDTARYEFQILSSNIN